MAFLNGKYTAFDPKITLTDVTDDDVTCVVQGTITNIDTSRDEVTIGSMDKSVTDIADAIANDKRIVFICNEVE